MFFHVGLVMFMLWTRVERVFALEAYLSSGRSIIDTQRAVRNHFNHSPPGRVPARKSIRLCVVSCRRIGDVQKNKRRGSRTVRTPENIERVGQSILRSSRRKHAVVLGTSERSVRRILHKELQFHPFVGMYMDLYGQRRKNLIQVIFFHEKKSKGIFWHIAKTICQYTPLYSSAMKLIFNFQSA